MNSKYSFEILSWLFIAVFTILLLYPIIQNLNVDLLGYLWRNVLMIVIFFTYIKFIFFHKFLFYSSIKIWKIFSLLSAIPSFFFYIDSYFFYFDLFDDSSDIYFDIINDIYFYWRVVSLLSVVTGIVSTFLMVIMMIRNMRPSS